MRVSAAWELQTPTLSNFDLWNKTRDVEPAQFLSKSVSSFVFHCILYPVLVPISLSYVRVWVFWRLGFGFNFGFEVWVRVRVLGFKIRFLKSRFLGLRSGSTFLSRIGLRSTSLNWIQIQNQTSIWIGWKFYVFRFGYGFGYKLFHYIGLIRERTRVALPAEAGN